MQPIISSPDRSADITSVMPPRPLSEPFRMWSGVSSEYPRAATVASLFEEIANQYPNAVALVHGDAEFTYKQLNARSNCLAHALRSAGVELETLVACCFDRPLETIIAFIAVLKAGGAYVPLDPTYPKVRIDEILQDADNPLLLTTKSLASSLFRDKARRIVSVDATSEDSPASEENLVAIAGPTNLAYVMYTSGSTGRPKGVMVEHRNIVRLVRSTNYCHFGPDEVFLQFAPPSFDASTFEIWGALLNGSRLVLMPERSSSLVDLVATVRKHSVTTLWLTAGLFQIAVEEHADQLRVLRQLLAGGDVLSPRHVRQFLQIAPHTTLINGYGPTENTTFTCCHIMRAGDSLPENIPIGKPVSNTRIYILDSNMNPVAVGETGELYVAGDGVARGYLNQPAMTAASFLPDPFVADAHERMYRTGDLVRWRADGSVEFLGRLDNQVKILGYRIEPSEIEAALERHNGIKRACVVRRAEDGRNRLCAYFIPAEPGVNADTLRRFAISQLPQHMVPSFFESLDFFPLSDNGKVDRAALANRTPGPNRQSAPKPVLNSDIERILTQLWERILKLQSVGLDDNFFDLGGDSLLLLAVHSNMQKQLKIEIPLTDLFEFSTIRKLAQHLGDSQLSPAREVDSKTRAQRQREAFARFRDRQQGAAS